MPTRILILAEIPTGPTGKVQRAGLADRLAPEFAVTYERPAKGLEQLSAFVFENILKLDRVGRNDNFFALGGDSIGAMQVVARLVKVLDIEIPPVILFRRPTPALLASELSYLQEKGKSQWGPGNLSRDSSYYPQVH